MDREQAQRTMAIPYHCTANASKYYVPISKASYQKQLYSHLTLVYNSPFEDNGRSKFHVIGSVGYRGHRIFRKGRNP